MMPDCARCRKARDAELRVMPDGDKRRKARKVGNDTLNADDHVVWRPLAFCALWHLARFGIMRGSALCAFWHFAPYGISRPSASCALRQFAPFIGCAV